MSISKTDLFHGAVLAKLLRESPTALRLFEHRASERAVYSVDGLPGNQQAFFFVKSSASPRSSKRNGGCSWSFTFLPEHMKELRDLRDRGLVQIALVCGSNELKGDGPPLEVCLVSMTELEKVVNLRSVSSESVRVESAQRKKLRLYGGGARDPLLIPRKRIDSIAEVFGTGG